MDILLTWYQVYIEAKCVLLYVVLREKKKNITKKKKNSSGWDEGEEKGGVVVGNGDGGGVGDVEADNGRQKINRHWYLLLIDWCLDWNLFKLSV